MGGAVIGFWSRGSGRFFEVGFLREAGEVAALIISIFVRL